MVEDSINIPATYFPFKLIPWEKFMQCFIYGVRWKKDNTLVFNKYLSLMGRGNGKTGFASWNNFFLLTAKHGIKNYDIDIHANNESQAKTSFDDVYKVIKDHSYLDKKVFKANKEVIQNIATNSQLRYNFCLDNDDEVDDPDMWEKACPSINYNADLKRKMFQEYSQMQRNTGLRLTFMTKRMNRPMEDTRFAVASYDDVLHTKEKEFTEKMDEVIGTVDFADRRDFASVGLLGKYDKDVYFKQHIFIHESALRLQNIKREVIDISINQGKAQIVHGKNIEADYIVGWFL